MEDLDTSLPSFQRIYAEFVKYVTPKLAYVV
jgi:hypothetical protein